MVAALALAAAAAEKWLPAEFPDSPDELFGTSRVVLDDGRVIVFGGEANGKVADGLWVFANNEWKVMEPAGDWPSPRIAATMAVTSEGKVYLQGEMDEDGPLSNLWILDPETGTWEEIEVVGERPQARAFSTSWYHEGRFYVAGGLGSDRRPRRELFIYSQGTSTWERGPDAPEPF